ncbi:CubicO group peptidase (beta-lactamase class C family) [Kribbella antiqua]|uniref:CubicO group peptidase (Beta-lactamase class C family) n=2 Tax=Kribbella antiqua TaxID=2512217 RepID=A0A4R2ITV6_9ACTN|nr:CubicO group peptidase (beta-lactamase class C family) [Kribbella antiqua]
MALMVLVAGCTAAGKGVAPPSTPGATEPPGVASRFPEPGTGPLLPNRQAALQAVLDRAVRDHAFYAGIGAPGVTAAVLTDQGSWMGAAGKGGDGRALVPEAMMGIASISKTFTAAEVLHLAAAGRVDLHAPMSRYVQHRLTGNGATVRQALGMQSGIRYHEPDTRAMLAAVMADPGRHWTPQDALVYQRATPLAPGGGPAYSDANYWLLGLLVEKVTGRSLAEALRADLLDPAGLDRVAVQDAERPTPPLGAPPGRLRLRPDGYVPCRALATVGGAAGGMAADASTLARWGYQLYGARLLPAETVHAMMTQDTPGTVFPGMGYGLGTMLFYTVGTETTVGHTGRSPAYSTMLAVIPFRHLAAAILIPDPDRDTAAIMQNLFAALR